MAKTQKIVIDAWPQLVAAIEQHQMLGVDVNDIAKFLLVEALESRQRERWAKAQARNAAIASGWRGQLD